MDTIRINSGKTKMIAHRGLSGIECENTAAAFVAAGNRDYFGIETDVHRTLDGKFIIIHDDNTSRVSADSLSVENNDFKTLRSVRLADKEGKIREDLCLPSLAEYLRICRAYGKTGVLELKNLFSEYDISEILKTVRNEYKIDKMIFISFHFDFAINLHLLFFSYIFLPLFLRFWLQLWESNPFSSAYETDEISVSLKLQYIITLFYYTKKTYTGIAILPR